MHSEYYEVWECIIEMSDLKFHKPFDIQSSYNVSDESLYFLYTFIHNVLIQLYEWLQGRKGKNKCYFWKLFCLLELIVIVNIHI